MRKCTRYITYIYAHICASAEAIPFKSIDSNFFETVDTIIGFESKLNCFN